MREEIIEHRLDDAFQFYRYSSLVCKESNVSNNINHTNNNYDMDINGKQSYAFQKNFNHNNNNRKFTFRPQFLV